MFTMFTVCYFNSQLFAGSQLHSQKLIFFCNGHKIVVSGGVWYNVMNKNIYEFFYKNIGGMVQLKWVRIELDKVWDTWKNSLGMSTIDGLVANQTV